MKFGYVSICNNRDEEYKEMEALLLQAESTKKLPYPIVVRPSNIAFVDLAQGAYSNIVDYSMDLYTNLNYKEISKFLQRGLIAENRLDMSLRGQKRDIPINILFLSITEMNANEHFLHLLHFDLVNVLVNATEDNIEREIIRLAKKRDCNVDEYTRYLNPFVHSLLRHMEFID